MNSREAVNVLYSFRNFNPTFGRGVGRQNCVSIVDENLFFLKQVSITAESGFAI